MNLVYGEIVDVNVEEGMQVGTVRISRVKKKVTLDLITEPRRGDKVLVCDGMVIAKVDPIHESPSTNHQHYVSGHSR
jgi:hydrogenase maturation factor